MAEELDDVVWLRAEDKDDQCCGWKLLTTARHHDAVDYSLLDRWFHSSVGEEADPCGRGHR